MPKSYSRYLLTSFIELLLQPLQPLLLHSHLMHHPKRLIPVLLLLLLLCIDQGKRFGATEEANDGAEGAEHEETHLSKLL